jgi:hypothetical protein
MPSTARTSLKTKTLDAAAAVRVLRDVDSSCHVFKWVMEASKESCQDESKQLALKIDVEKVL